MIFNYESIKQLAKKIGRCVPDLLALAPANDPFYVTPGQQEVAEWFVARWNELGLESGVHLRRVHYTLVSQSPRVKRPDGSDYENTEKCWGWLVSASLSARYLGLINSDDLVDRRNPEPEEFDVTCDDPEPEVEIDYNDDWEAYGLPSVPELPDIPGKLPPLPRYKATYLPDETEQPVLVEIWAEKTTQNDILLPICDRYGVNLITGMGELSETACYRFCQRVLEAGKPGRILYISDFDPAGNDMPVSVARKVEFHRRSNPDFHELDIRLKPIILTQELVAKHDLPRIPVKDSDKRKERFEMVNGVGQVELDALEAIYPGEFGLIVVEAVLQYRDPTLRDRTEQAYESFREYLASVSGAIYSQYSDRSDGLDKEYRALRNEWQALRKEFAKLTAPFIKRIETLTGRMEDLRERAESLQVEVLEHHQAHIDDGVEHWEAPEPCLPDEPDGQLYDSRRDYLEQLDAYKDYRDGEEREVAA